MNIIVDSDGLIGLIDKEDIHNLASQKIIQELIVKKARLIYPATVIVESTTVLKLRLKKPELADQIGSLLLSGQLIIEPIDEYLLKEAVDLLSQSEKDKHNTLFDAVVASVAKKYKADAIFSFDKFYRKLGFKLASEL